MARIEAIARERGLIEVPLDTAVAMTDLVAFYVKRGYVAYDPVINWQGTNYESQHYKKVLRPRRT